MFFSLVTTSTEIQKTQPGYLLGSDLFKINENSGNITMVKPADVLGPISLTVLVKPKHSIAFMQFIQITVFVSLIIIDLHCCNDVMRSLQIKVKLFPTVVNLHSISMATRFM